MTAQPVLHGFGRAGGNSATTSGASTGYLTGICGGEDQALEEQSTETNVSIKTRYSSGTMSNFGINVLIGGNTPPTWNTRINSANGNESISPPANTAGWFSDATHTDSISNGDMVNISIVGTATPIETDSIGGGAILITPPSSDAIVNYCMTPAPGFNPWTMNYNTMATYFLPINGQVGPAWTGDNEGETTETGQTRTIFRASGTLSNLQTRCSTIGAFTLTVQSRVNGAFGNQSISVNASGFFEDTTHVDSIGAGQPANYAATFPVNTFLNTDILFIASKFTSGDAHYDTFSSEMSQHTGCTNAVTYYGAYGSYHTADTVTTESFAQLKTPIAIQFGNLRCYVVTYSLGSPVTYSFRNNGSAGNQSVSLSGTGNFEDSTHTDLVPANNAFCYSISSPGGTSGLVVPWFGITQIPSSALPQGTTRGYIF